MIGKGKYDGLCNFACAQARAQGALLIILGGDKGSGFSATLPPGVVATIPDVLRQVANQIEEQAREIKGN